MSQLPAIDREDSEEHGLVVISQLVTAEEESLQNMAYGGFLLLSMSSLGQFVVTVLSLVRLIPSSHLFCP